MTQTRPDPGQATADDLPRRATHSATALRVTPLLTAVLLAGVFGVALAVGFLGLYVRPTSDDYRLAAFARDGGISGTAAEFYLRVTGRVGNGILVGLVYAFPDAGPRLVPLVAFVALALVLGLLLRWGLPYAGVRPSRAQALLGGSLLATVVLLGQPHPYQTLFWTPGVITHTFPLIGLAGTVALALRAESRRARRLMCAAAPAAGCFLATVGEPVALLWLAIVAALAALHRRYGRQRAYAAAFTVGLTAGFVLGLAVVMTSPGNAAREAGAPSFPGSAPNPLDPAVFRDAVAMSFEALRYLACSASPIAAFGIGFLLGVLAPTSRGPAKHAPKKALPAATVAGAAFLVNWADRYGFGAIKWVGYRTWIGFALLGVLAMAYYGCMAARALPRRASAASALATAGILLAVGAGYVSELQALGRQVVARAAAWDAQSAQIAQARARGDQAVPYRPLPIDGLTEPFSAPPGRDWIVPTIERYFQVAKIENTTGGSAHGLR